MQFNNKSSLWTCHCGIVSLNSNYSLKHISAGIDDGRYILASVHLSRDLELSPTTPPIATILNIYGRAQAHSDRSAFYTELIGISIVKDTITNITNTIFIMGDFNYQYKDRRQDRTLISAPVEWTDMLDDYFIDVFGEDKHNTWHSGTTAAILDYSFVSAHAYHQVTSSHQQYLSPDWTDHELLGFSFQFLDASGRGPGNWKANPFLARSKDFRRALAEFLQGSLERLEEVRQFSSPQLQWDWIKAEVKMFIKQYQVEDVNWRKHQLKRLLSKRNKMMRHRKDRGLVFQGLDAVNQQIQSLQHSLAEIEILKAGKFWREHGEKSSGFFN